MAISSIQGPCGGSCNCRVSSLPTGCLLMVSQDPSECSPHRLLQHLRPVFSLPGVAALIGATLRCLTGHLDRCFFPNFTGTQLLCYSRYLSFPFQLQSFFPEIPDLWHFIITGSLLPSSTQASFFLPWLVMLGIRRDAGLCY